MRHKPTAEEIARGLVAAVNESDQRVGPVIDALRAILASSHLSDATACETIGWRLTSDLILGESCSAGMTSLPTDLRVLIEDLATFLHDVHSARDIPKMFESDPQQLLRRLDELDDTCAGE